MRLIDADILKEKLKSNDKEWIKLHHQWIDAQPTVNVLDKLREEINGFKVELNRNFPNMTAFDKGMDFAYDTVLTLINEYKKGE